MEPRIEITKDPIPVQHKYVGKRKSNIRASLEAMNKGECLVLDFSEFNLPRVFLTKKAKNIRSIIHHVKKNTGKDFTTRFDTFKGVFRIWRIA